MTAATSFQGSSLFLPRELGEDPGNEDVIAKSLLARFSISRNQLVLTGVYRLQDPIESSKKVSFYDFENVHIEHIVS